MSLAKPFVLFTLTCVTFVLALRSLWTTRSLIGFYINGSLILALALNIVILRKKWCLGCACTCAGGEYVEQRARPSHMAGEWVEGSGASVVVEPAEQPMAELASGRNNRRVGERAAGVRFQGYNDGGGGDARERGSGNATGAPGDAAASGPNRRAQAQLGFWNQWIGGPVVRPERS